MPLRGEAPDHAPVNALRRPGPTEGSCAAVVVRGEAKGR
ncbi:hypothetical protein SROCM77S_01400 [Streptomyces rochei]